MPTINVGSPVKVWQEIQVGMVQIAEGFVKTLGDKIVKVRRVELRLTPCNT